MRRAQKGAATRVVTAAINVRSRSPWAFAFVAAVIVAACRGGGDSGY